MSLSSASHAQSAFPLLDPEFKVPETLETDRFHLRMLTVNDVVKDYDAVMSSKQHLHELFGPGWQLTGLSRILHCPESAFPKRSGKNCRSLSVRVA